MDASRRLLFLAIRPSGEPTVILSSDTLYVKASVLPGWRITKPWLSVPLADVQILHDVTTALGLWLSAKFWDPQDSFKAFQGHGSAVGWVASVRSWLARDP